MPVVTGLSFVSSVRFARTADTNAYLANDIVGAATGSTAALTFASVGPSTRASVMITSVELEIDITAVISGMTSFRLYLYSVTPPSALGDNTPFDLPSGDRSAFLGYVDLGTPVDLGSTLYVQTLGVNKQLVMPGNSGGVLYGYLVTVGAYTPAASSVFKTTLHGIGL